MNEYGYSLAFKRRITILVHTLVGLASVWWMMRHAYAHSWWDLATSSAYAALYYWFGVRSHLRWYREELAADG